MDEHQFDYRERLAELRCRPTAWLRARRAELVREQRRLRVEELAVTAVLDERGGYGDRVAAEDGLPVEQVRQTAQTARALEHLPAVAGAAHAGTLSGEQLEPLARLADPESDAEWAQRGARCSPADLARLARTATKPTPDDTRRRRERRHLFMSWRREQGMLAFRGELPDLDGALLEAVINRMIDRMRPAKGQPWDTRARRGADALVELCRNYADVDAVTCPKPLLVVEVPLEGPAQICGIPLPDEMVESLRAQARVEPVLVDPQGTTIATGRSRPTLSPKIVRAVLLRDGHCRWPGCTRRHGLQVNHLWPRIWGGNDHLTNLAAVCVGGGTDHHPKLAPHGPYLLVGNPNQPDGLTLVHRDRHPDIRAGPDP